MTNSASQATHAPFEHSLGIIRQASIEILRLKMRLLVGFFQLSLIRQ